MTATTQERHRLNDIIAGHTYNPAQWDSDFQKFQRITAQSLKNPAKYKPEEIEARAEDLCNRKFGAIYSDLKEYFKGYELPIIRLLSMLLDFFIRNGNMYEYTDYTMTDDEILSSIRMAVREYADEHAKEIFGIDITKAADQQQYNKAPVKYKDSFEMPIDKVNSKLFDLLHSPDMKMKYNVVPENQAPVYVTAQLQYPYNPDPKEQQKIIEGVKLLKNLSYSVDVLQAAYQLYQPDKEIEFSAADIYRILETRYKETHGQVPATSEKEIDDILHAWFSMLIAIGAEQQATQWRRADPEKVSATFTRENFFRVLPVQFSKATYIRRPGGSEQYQITEKPTYKFNAGGRTVYPPLLDYNKSVSGQIATFDDKLLNSPGKFSGLSKTINTHLLKYVDQMKQQNRSTKIRYTTLAHDIGYFRQRVLNPSDYSEDMLDQIPKKQKQTLRDTVKKYLDSFVREGFISGYSEYPKDERSKSGVEIILPGQDQDQQPIKKKKRSSKKEGG